RGAQVCLPHAVGIPRRRERDDRGAGHLPDQVVRQRAGRHELAARVMSPPTLLGVQWTLSLVAYALLARWYVAPRLAARPREDAVVPLLWIHVFRYAPAALFAPGQVDQIGRASCRERGERSG